MKRLVPLIAAPLVVLASYALAAAEPAIPSPASEVVFFIQVAILIVAGRIGGELMQRIGQPAVMGQLVAGIVLGPSFFGVVLPDLQATVFPPDAQQRGMLDAVAQLGVLLLLLLTGMETDLRLVRRVGPPALFVSLAGIAVPFALGFLVGEVAPEWIIPNPEMRVVTSLFLGTALSIASVKIVAMVVRDLGFLRRNVGQIILASAVLDDTLGWIIIGVISGLATSGTLQVSGILLTVLGVVVFLVASLTVGRRAVSLLIRWTNDNLVSEMPVISVILAMTLGMALITQWIGVHTVLGAFVAGVLIGELPILTKHIDEELRGLITALFMPVFFCLAGLSADLTVLADPTLLALTVGLILIASLGKFGGAFLGGWLGGLSFRERVALACGMNARGSTEVIVATIGLSIGALNRDLYTMIVTMAVVTTLAMPPMLRWALNRLPLEAEEKERLEREEFEEKGFVSNLERLLLTVDDSANGKLASRLAGLVRRPARPADDRVALAEGRAADAPTATANRTPEGSCGGRVAGGRGGAHHRDRGRRGTGEGRRHHAARRCGDRGSRRDRGGEGLRHAVRRGRGGRRRRQSGRRGRRQGGHCVRRAAGARPRARRARVPTVRCAFSFR